MLLFNRIVFCFVLFFNNTVKIKNFALEMKGKLKRESKREKKERRSGNKDKNMNMEKPSNLITKKGTETNQQTNRSKRSKTKPQQTRKNVTTLPEERKKREKYPLGKREMKQKKTQQ